MNANEFVNELAKLIHSSDFYINRGLSSEEADEMIEDEKKSLLLSEKHQEPLSIEDPIENLICSYDTSNLEIGMVKLGKQISICNIPSGKVPIGAIEADPLVINSESGEIELLDHSQPDFIVAKCAISSEKFMEALLLLAFFVPPHIDLYGNLPKDQVEKNNSAAYDMAAKCAIVAGISGNKNIYETLLGCE